MIAANVACHAIYLEVQVADLLKIIFTRFVEYADTLFSVLFLAWLNH